jgi:hypothetical protein
MPNTFLETPLDVGLRPARGADVAMAPMRLDNYHPLRLKAGRRTGVAIQPRTRSSGWNISHQRNAAEFGRRLPWATMFRDMKSPLGSGTRAIKHILTQRGCVRQSAMGRVLKGQLTKGQYRI